MIALETCAASIARRCSPLDLTVLVRVDEAGHANHGIGLAIEYREAVLFRLEMRKAAADQSARS